jgi:hypothetical protein
MRWMKYATDAALFATVKQRLGHQQHLARLSGKRDGKGL